jgi:hypothetical protein
MRLVGTIGRMRLVLLLVGAVIAGLAALAPAQAADSGVPITIRLSGTAVYTSETTVQFDGAGTATHLGQVTDHGLAVLSAPVPGCPGGALGLPSDHIETITAANGDTLVLRLTSFACPSGPNSVRCSGTWIVIDGTGRFADASGSGRCEGGADFGSNTFAGTLTGTIRYT